MSNDKLVTKVVTGKVRLSYCHLFEPHSNNPQQEAKFSVAILIPKADKATYDKIKAAQNAAAQKGADKVFGGKVPSNYKHTLKDGDDADQVDHEVNPEFRGHWVMTVSSKQRPGVVDLDLNPILDSTQVYSGCYARVSINAFAYSNSGNKGVSFGLNHVQFLADGEPLGGRTRAQDDFADFSGAGDDSGMI